MKLKDQHFRGLLSIYLILVYLFGIITRGAWSDDYAAMFDPTAVGMHALRDSRPIYGLSISFLFTFFDSIGLLVFIRFLGLLGLVLLNNELWFRFRNYPKNRTVMILCTFGLTLPSFQFSSHWAIAFAMSWATYLGLIGLRFFSSNKFSLRIYGILVLVLSLLTYPLVAFFIFSVVFIEGLLSKETIGRVLLRLTTPIWYLFIGIPSSYLIAMIVMRFAQTTPNERVQLVAIENFPEKIVWFLTRPFALSYRPFLISSPTVGDIFFFISLGSIAIFLLLVFYYHSLKHGIVIFLIFNAVIMASVFPLLLVSQNQIDVRFLEANTWLVLVTLLFLLSNFLSEKFKVVGKKLIVLGGVTLLVYGFWSVNDRYTSFMRPIFVGNQKFIQSELTKCGPLNSKLTIEIVQRSEPWGSKPLLGFYSQVSDLQSEWVPEGAVTAFMNSVNIALEHKPNLIPKPARKYSCHILLNQYQVKS